jgi:hypothetical protein
VNPLKLAIAAGASFVGRGVSWQRNELAALMTTAINTNGFSLVDVFSPCVTWHREPGFRGSGPIFDWYKQNFVLDIKDAWQSMRDQVFNEEEKSHLPVDYDPKSPDGIRIRRISDHARTCFSAPSSSSQGVSMPGVWDPCPGARSAITSITKAGEPTGTPCCKERSTAIVFVETLQKCLPGERPAT